MRLLIIEDEPGIRKLVATYLAPYASCDEAEDGERGLAMFADAREQSLPYDAIILDIMMPGMNGGEVLENIRRIENGQGVPEVDGVKIIMLTALDDTRSVLTSFKHRCNAYIVKPFDEAALVSELTDLGLLRA